MFLSFYDDLLSITNAFWIFSIVKHLKLRAFKLNTWDLMNYDVFDKKIMYFWNYTTLSRFDSWMF